VVSYAAVLSIALVAVGLVLTPGPNTVFLLSRTIAQGKAAGLVCLLGSATGLLVYLAGAAAGLLVLLRAVPFLYDGVRLLGAGYLFLLAWQAIRAGRGRRAEAPEPAARPRLRLYLAGLATNLLNPTIAILYLSLLPQFVDAQRGHAALQGVILGLVQIFVTVSLNGLVVLAADRIGPWFTDRPQWTHLQRVMTAGVLGALAIRLLAG
jgi:threonine/homoserine/homoserine lactone efflux protein